MGGSVARIFSRPSPPPPPPPAPKPVPPPPPPAPVVAKKEAPAVGEERRGALTGIRRRTKTILTGGGPTGGNLQQKTLLGQ